MLLASAMKIAEGQVMYRDFFEFWTPGSIYLVGLIFRFFGQSWLVERAIYIPTALSLLVVIYYTLKTAGFSARQRTAALIITAFCTQMLYIISHHWYGQIGQWATLLAILLASKHQKQSLAFLAGLIAGVTAVFMQYEGVIALAGGALSIAVAAPQKERRRWAFLFIFGASLVAISVFTYFFIQNAFSSLIYSTIEFPIKQYAIVNKGPLSALWVTQSLLLVMMIMYYRQRAIPLNKNIVLMLIFALATQVVALSTKGEFHPLFMGSLVIALLVWWVSDIVRGETASNNLQQVFTYPLKRFAASFWCLLIFTVYVALVASLGLTAWSDMKLGKAYKTLELPIGNVRVENADAERIISLQHKLSNPIENGESLYFGPYVAYYHYIMQIALPIKYTQLTPGYNPDWMIEDAVSDLVHSNTTHVVFLPSQSVFSVSTESKLYSELQKHYTLVEVLPKAQIPDIQNRKYKLHDAPDSIWALKE